MKMIIACLFLVGCAKSIPGNYNLVQCGQISGCDVEYIFNSKDACQAMADQFKGSTFRYVCVEVK